MSSVRSPIAAKHSASAAASDVRPSCEPTLMTGSKVRLPLNQCSRSWWLSARSASGRSGRAASSGAPITSTSSRSERTVRRRRFCQKVMASGRSARVSIKRKGRSNAYAILQNQGVQQY